MRKTREQIEYQLSIKRNRLELYLKREAEMLDGGVQSYGIGSRNLARYNTDLGSIRAAIKQLERSPERGFFHRPTPGVFAPFLPTRPSSP